MDSWASKNKATAPNTKPQSIIVKGEKAINLLMNGRYRAHIIIPIDIKIDQSIVLLFQRLRLNNESKLYLLDKILINWQKAIVV